MKKIMTKTLSLLICIAFSSLQISMAAVLTNGDFAGRQVLSGAKISGHTAGLQNVSNETISGVNHANLKFNANTRIDWTNLNVNKLEQLNFKNGNFGVLNNVTKGISNFAGKITAENGKIIISNPNGILFSGGKFESAGSLVLTTKDLTNVDVTAGTNLDSLNISDADNGNSNFSVVVISSDSSITSPDINIIANGVSISDSILSSPSANGVVLITSDGANFTMGKTATLKDADGNTVLTKKFNYTNSLANSAISTDGGSVTLVANNTAASSNLVNNTTVNGDLTLDGSKYGMVTGSTINGNAVVKADSTRIYNGSTVNGNASLVDTVEGAQNAGMLLLDSTVTGNFSAKGATGVASGNVQISNSTVNGTVDVASGAGMVVLDTVNAGETNVEALKYVRIAGNNTFNGDLNINDAYMMTFGYYDSVTHELGKVNPVTGVAELGTTTVHGDINANVLQNIGYSDKVVADGNITLVSRTSSILSSHADKGDGQLVANNGKVTLTATNGEITSLNANVEDGSSPYYEIVTKDDEPITIEVLAQDRYRSTKDYVYVEAKDAELTAAGRIALRSNVSNDLKMTSGQIAYLKGSVGGNVDATGDTVQVIGATVGGNAELKGDYVRVESGSNIAGDLTMIDTKQSKASNGLYLMGNSHVGGDLVAKGADGVNNGNVQILNSSVDGDVTITITADSANGVTNDPGKLGMVVLNNVAFGGDTVIDNQSGRYVRVAGNDTFANDLTIDAAWINLGNVDSSTGLLTDGSITVGNALTARAVDTVGFSSDVTAKSMYFSSEKSSLVQGVASNRSGSLTTDSLTVVAPTGGAVALDANPSGSESAYAVTLYTDYIPGDKSAADFGAINVTSKTAGSDLVIKDGAAVANFNTDAAKTVITGNGTSTIKDLKLSTNGNVDASNITAVKASNSTNNTGSVVISTTKQDGTVKIGSVNTDTNIEVYAYDSSINVAGNLTADKEGNGVGDIILRGKTLDGENFTSVASSIAIKGANVELTQSADADTIRMSNITAVGKDDATGTTGDITITVPNAQAVDLANINATHDITVLNDTTVPASDVIFNTIKLSNVKADSELNGRGDLNLKASGDIKATNVGGANITLTSTNGNVSVNGATSARSAADTTSAAQASKNGGTKSGNVVLTADNGNVVIGNVNAGSDIIASANKTHGTVTVTGPIAADAENAIGVAGVASNTYGDVILSGRTLQGGMVDNVSGVVTPAILGSTGSIKGASVELNQTAPVDTLTLTNIIADATDGNGGNNAANNAGDITINIPANKIDFTNISATKDINVNNALDANGNSVAGVLDSAILNNVIADSEGNGVGDLNIKTTGDIIANTIGGANINLESETGNITVNGAESHRGNQPDANAGNIKITVNADDANITVGGVEADTNIIVDASKGSVTQTGKLTADKEGNGVGTVSIVAKDDLNVGGAGKEISGGDVYIESKEGSVNASDITADGHGNDNHGDVTIIANNGDTTVDGVNGTHDVVITAGGDATVTDTHADTDNNKQGDLIINAGGKATVGDETKPNDVTGNNVTINADDDIIANNVTGKDDVTIISDNGKVTGNDLIADGDGDKIGDLYIRGNGDVTVDGGSGSNVDIISDKGDVDANDIHATGDDSNDDGNINIEAKKGDVTIDNSDSTNDIVITVTDGDVNVGPNVTPDVDGNTIGELIINRDPHNPYVDPVNPVYPGADDSIAQEVVKNLNNLQQSGIDTQMAQSFTPIAFAAEDEEDESEVLKRIVKTVFKTPETGIVTITDKFKSVK